MTTSTTTRRSPAKAQATDPRSVAERTAAVLAFKPLSPFHVAILNRADAERNRLIKPGYGGYRNNNRI